MKFFRLQGRSPYIISVGQRPTKTRKKNHKPQRGVINFADLEIRRYFQKIRMMIAPLQGFDFISNLHRALPCANDSRLSAFHWNFKFAILFFIFLFFANIPLAADPATHAFTWHQANTRAATASTRAEFLDAARLYDQLPPDGGVMLNMGATLLMANEPRAAYEAFARAERRLGHTVPGLSRDINLALHHIRGAPGGRALPDRPWPRVLFFWHYALPMDTRLLLGATGWAVLWLAFLLSRFLPSWQGWRRATKEIALGIFYVAATALLLIFGASGIVSVAQEFTERHRSPLEWLAPETEEIP